MTLNAREITHQLSGNAIAAANLSLSCQGVLETHLQPVASPWYADLNSQLQQAQALAGEWRTRFGNELQTDALTCVIHRSQAFAARRAIITHLFTSPGWEFASCKAHLIAELTSLQSSTLMIVSTTAAYEAQLRDWGQRLSALQGGLGCSVAQIQAEGGDLQAQVGATNIVIATLTAEVVRARRGIAEAASKNTSGFVGTVFSVLLAPFTGGPSLILAGIGVSSKVGVQNKVSALESTIRSYQQRVLSSQQVLGQEQAQMVALNGLLVSGNIALHDVQVTSQMLDRLRTSWDVFFRK